VINAMSQEDIDMSQTTTLQARDLAERLVALETRGSKSSGRPTAFAAVEKLRQKLATLLGNTGFRALLSRALARAEEDVPSLRALRVEPDGTLGGVAEFKARVDPRELAEGRVALVAHLLRLLVAFIGEDLTLRLTREVWPTLHLNDWMLAGDIDE
jgi:hypothetical protein